MNRRNRLLGWLGAAIVALSLTAPPLAWAQATNQRQCTTVDLAGMTITNDCNGDVVTLTSGTMTTCAEAVFDASGGKHAVVQVHGQGFGVGGSSRYVFHINALASIQLPSSGTDVVTAVAQAGLIAQGSATNEVVDVLLHVTVDANGNPTAMVDKMTMHCQG